MSTAKLRNTERPPTSTGSGSPVAADRGTRYLLVVLVGLNLILLIAAVRYITLSDIDSDEVEHAHVTWALNQGVLPYRDLHQNHTPLLWLLFSPVMRFLPHSVETLVLLRWACALAFAGTCAAGLLALREVMGAVRLEHGLLLLLVSLSVFAAFDCYNFRPDPFMTLAAALGILAAARLGRGPWRYSFLCGLAFGVAASFSSKIAPLCLLVPVLSVVECRRLGTFRPVWLVAANALGFLVGVAPVAGWLFAHHLFEPFRQENMINSQLLNLWLSYLPPTINAGKLITALAIAGGWLVMEMEWERTGQAHVSADQPGVAARRVRGGPDGPRATGQAAHGGSRCAEPVPRSWAPGHAMVAAGLLALLVPMLEPNHLAYNLQVFVMPGAVLGTALLAKLAEPGGWPRRLQLALVTVALAYITAGPAVEGVGTARTMGGAIPMADLERLIALCTSRDLTCVALTPYHPIYCRDAAEAYLVCDYAIATSTWIPKAAVQHYREMFPRAVAAIVSHPPSFLVTPEIWDRAMHDGLIDQDEFGRLRKVIQSYYQPARVGRTSVLVRTDLLRPGR